MVCSKSTSLSWSAWTSGPVAVLENSIVPLLSSFQVTPQEREAWLRTCQIGIRHAWSETDLPELFREPRTFDDRR